MSNKIKVILEIEYDDNISDNDMRLIEARISEIINQNSFSVESNWMKTVTFDVKREE